MPEAWQQRFSRSEFANIQNANASIAGVPFILKSSSSSFGKRLVVHEYPKRDVPYIENLGRKVRPFTVQGMVLGAEYLSTRDSITAVCESSGSKKLIHPYFGDLTVECEDVTFDDTNEETRLTRFKAVFIESGKSLFPDTTIDTTAAVEIQAQVTLESLKTPFEKTYDDASIPLVFTSKALISLEKAWDDIEKVKTIVNVAPEFLRDLQAIRSSAGAIVASGLSTFNSIVDLVTFGLFTDNINRDESIDDTESFNTLKDLLNFTSETDSTSVKSTSIDFLVQEAATITMGLNTSRIAFTSSNEAREFRNILLLKIDEITLRGTTEDVTNEYNKLRAIITEDIDSRAITLPELKTFTPAKTQPSVKLSQLLYGDSNQAEDIVSRNNIEHPGFIPSGKELEVLLDG